MIQDGTEYEPLYSRSVVWVERYLIHTLKSDSPRAAVLSYYFRPRSIVRGYSLSAYAGDICGPTICRATTVRDAMHSWRLESMDCSSAGRFNPRGLFDILFVPKYIHSDGICMRTPTK